MGDAELEAVAEELMHAFVPLRRQQWRPHSIAGLTPGEAMILFSLRDVGAPQEPGVDISEIRRRLRLDAATLTQQLNTLETQGYVEQSADPQDPQVLRIRLRPGGLAVVEEFRQRPGRLWRQDPGGGLSRNDALILLFVERADGPSETGMKVSDISARLRVASPTITQHINALEGRGYVERHPDPTDRRVIRVRLTPAGEAVLAQAHLEFLTVFRGLVASLGAEDSKQLADLLGRVATYFATLRDPGSPPGDDPRGS